MIVSADVHDPLGLQLATIRKLQQRSRPIDVAERQQYAQAEDRQDTPDDVRFMRTTLSLEAMMQQMGHTELQPQTEGSPRRRRVPPRKRHESKQAHRASPTKATPQAVLEPYSAMTKDNRRLLQKRARRYGHLHTVYDVHDRATLHMTV